MNQAAEDVNGGVEQLSIHFAVRRARLLYVLTPLPWTGFITLSFTIQTDFSLLTSPQPSPQILPDKLVVLKIGIRRAHPFNLFHLPG